MKLIFLIFLLVPLLEIYFLLAVGGLIGAGLTILLVVFTAVFGAALVRAQGFASVARMQAQLARGQLPALAILEGLLLLVAGALLLTPGFFTDAVGFALLLPPWRRKLIRWAVQRGLFPTMSAHTVHTSYAQSETPQSECGGRVIDVESDNNG